MRRPVHVGMVALAGWLLAAPLQAQETPSAQATRKKLQQKLSLEFDNEGTKAIFDFIKGEMDKPVAFKIDNASGVSNNAKMTYKCKDKTVEQILNDLCAIGDFGWFVKSDAKDRLDGFVIIRKYKEKERGYEGGGTEPKKKAALEVMPHPTAAALLPWLAVAQAKVSMDLTIERGLRFLHQAQRE